MPRKFPADRKQRRADKKQSLAAARSGSPTMQHLFANAVKLHQAGRLTEAEPLYRQILQIDPRHGDALHLLGVIAHQVGRHDVAIELIGKAIAQNGQIPVFHSNLGNALQAQGSSPAAAKSYRRALVLAPDLGGTYYNLGNACQTQARADLAVAAYRRALNCQPASVQVYCNLGNALKQLGKLEAAARACTRALILLPEHAEANYNLAIIFTERGQSDASVTAYGRALRLRPDYVEAHYNLGLALQEQGRLNAAAAAYRQAVSHRPNYDEAYGNLGKLSWNRGNLGEALEQLEAASRCAAERATFDGGNIISLQEFTIFNMIKSWIDYHYSAMNNTARNARNIEYVSNVDSNKRIKFVNGYKKYLSLLLDYRSDNKLFYDNDECNALVAFGDSHTLSLHGIALDLLGVPSRGDSHLIAGIKMWHVSQAEGNFFAACLLERIARLPSGTDLLFCIGEIDCRQDEGIWATYKRKGGNLSEIIAVTANGYLQELANILRETHPSSVTIHGVPAPVVTPSADNSIRDFSEYLTMVAMVNKNLEQGSLANGWNFLDVYAATRGADGASHGQWHLDEFHLQPGFYRQARQWLKRPLTPAIR